MTFTTLVGEELTPVTTRFHHLDRKVTWLIQ
jgi:hypothetical protein